MGEPDTPISFNRHAQMNVRRFQLTCTRWLRVLLIFILIPFLSAAARRNIYSARQPMLKAPNGFCAGVDFFWKVES
jgi:hypothetical protein